MQIEVIDDVEQHKIDYELIDEMLHLYINVVLLYELYVLKNDFQEQKQEIDVSTFYNMLNN